MARTTKRKELQDLKTRVEKLEAAVKDNQDEIRTIKVNEAMKLLDEKNDLNPDKYKYTYDDIANHLETSKGFIANVAKEKGLSRRKN